MPDQRSLPLAGKDGLDFPRASSLDLRIRLLSGDITAAKAIGLSTKLFVNRPPGPPDDATVAFVRPMVEKVLLALCVNEAWAMLACMAIAGLLLVPFARDRSD